MSSLSPEARSIIDAARSGEDLGVDARARVKRSLMIATGVAAAGTSAATATKAAAGAAATTTASIPMAGGVGLVTKVGVSVLLVGVVGVGAQRILSDDVPAPAATGVASVARSALPVPSPTAQPTGVSGVLAPKPVASDDAPEPAAKERVARPMASSIAAETALLQQAQSELQSGEPERALELLDQHAREHASGTLREERQAARVLALCRAGRAEQARAEARRFAAEFPRSPHRARVLSACAQPK